MFRSFHSPIPAPLPIPSLCYAKYKNVPAEKRGQFGFGDVWTWVALCADTKLVVTWATMCTRVSADGSGNSRSHLVN